MRNTPFQSVRISISITFQSKLSKPYKPYSNQDATLTRNRVNSRELRRVIEETIEEAEIKPTHIRFFRGSMFNMMNIALQELSNSDDITIIPSRCTYALSSWLDERHREVYPKMEGYRPTMMSGGGGGAVIGGDFLDIRTPVKLPG